MLPKSTAQSTSNFLCLHAGSIGNSICNNLGSVPPDLKDRPAWRSFAPGEEMWCAELSLNTCHPVNTLLANEWCSAKPLCLMSLTTLIYNYSVDIYKLLKTRLNATNHNFPFFNIKEVIHWHSWSTTIGMNINLLFLNVFFN